MAKLKVLKCFGFRGASVAPGDVIDWDQALDGDTMGDFVKAGLCEAVAMPVAPASVAPKDKFIAAETPAASESVSER